MRKLLAYRYTFISFVLVLCELFVGFGLVSRWYLGLALSPHSERLAHLENLCLLVGLAAIGFAGLGLAKEETKPPAVTAAASASLAFFLCLLRFAV